MQAQRMIVTGLRRHTGFCKTIFLLEYPILFLKTIHHFLLSRFCAFPKFLSYMAFPYYINYFTLWIPLCSRLYGYCPELDIWIHPTTSSKTKLQRLINLWDAISSFCFWGSIDIFMFYGVLIVHEHVLLFE